MLLFFIAALNNDLIDISDLAAKLEKLKSKNFLATICLVNNETGTIQNVKEVTKLVHQKDENNVGSNTLQAMKADSRYLRNTIRVSFGVENSRQEVDKIY